jgi:hypothetical protein
MFGPLILLTLYLIPLDFLLWGRVKDQVYSQRVNMLDELKVRITEIVADVTKYMLQHI